MWSKLLAGSGRVDRDCDLEGEIAIQPDLLRGEICGDAVGLVRFLISVPVAGSVAGCSGFLPDVGEPLLGLRCGLWTW